MIGPTCRHCGEPIPWTYGHRSRWLQRKYCTPRCSRIANLNIGGRDSTIGRDEDIDLLISMGVAPREVADRLGIQVASVARWLTRHNRRDLSPMFWREAKREQAAASRRAA